MLFAQAVAVKRLGQCYTHQAHDHGERQGTDDHRVLHGELVEHDVVGRRAGALDAPAVGVVQGGVEVAETSGDEVFDAMAVRAVLKAERFVITDDPALFEQYFSNFLIAFKL